MPRLFISRLLETFFRRKWLYLLAVVPFVALGVVTVLNSSEVFRASGVMLVNKTTPTSSTNPFAGGASPAVATSGQIGTVLGTDKFLLAVKAAAEEQGAAPLTKEQVASAISTAPVGDDLVIVSASTADAGLSALLANTTIERFRESLKDNIRNQNREASAEDGAVPAPPSDAVLAAEATAFDEIEDRYQTYQLAEAPPAPEPHRQKDVFTVVLFLILGVMVSAAAAVVATLMDRSVRYGEEIETQLHVPVLASVPNSRAAIKPLVV